MGKKLIYTQTNPLFVNDIGGGGGGGGTPGTVANGQTSVATAGTAVALAGTTTIQSISVRANTGNTNNIYVGNASVSSSNGFILAAGEGVSFDIDDPAKVFIDSDTNGEGVSFLTVAA